MHEGAGKSGKSERACCSEVGLFYAFFLMLSISINPNKQAIYFGKYLYCAWLVVWNIFPYIGNNHPNWLSYFSEGLNPPTRHIHVDFYLIFYMYVFSGTLIPFCQRFLKDSPAQLRRGQHRQLQFLPGPMMKLLMDLSPVPNKTHQDPPGIGRKWICWRSFVNIIYCLAIHDIDGYKWVIYQEMMIQP